LYGTSGQLSVAQGALWGVGAYVAALGLQRWNIDFWVALPIAALAAGLVAGCIGFPARRIRGHYFVIITFAFASILPIFANNAIQLTGGNQGLVVSSAVRGTDAFGLDPLIGGYYVAFGLYLAALVAACFLQTSRFGHRLFAARHNATFAQSLGMNVDRDRLLAFVISGAFAGVGGVLYAYTARYVQPDLFNVWSGITFVMIVMVGGRGYLLGPLIGAVVAVLVPQALGFSPVFNRIAFGVILVLAILILPNGIMGASMTGIRRMTLAAGGADK
jgi:ABC-type branched-subunit amino acid transport system permease subunit